MEKYAEILAVRLNLTNKVEALQKISKATNTFSNVVNKTIKVLDKIATPIKIMDSLYDVALKDYNVEIAKLNALEAILEQYKYDYLLTAVRELKSEMETGLGRAINEAKDMAIDKAMDFVLKKTNGLWDIVASAVKITVGQDAMAKRDACYILEIEDAIYWYLQSLMYSYRDSGNSALLQEINHAIHAYVDCKIALNSLAIELNTWGVFVTDKDKYDYLTIYKYWYTNQHDDVDEFFADFVAQ